MTEHVCRSSIVLDSIPPTRICDCGATLPLTDADKREYRDYTGRDYVSPAELRAAAGLGKP